MTDFQVGDMVEDPVRFEGEQPIISIDDSDYPIELENQERYTLDGKRTHDDLKPSLHHAGTKITIQEAEPVLWPWVNVYRSLDKKDVVTGHHYKTKEAALENKGYNYLFTIQLKPQEE